MSKKVITPPEFKPKAVAKKKARMKLAEREAQRKIDDKYADYFWTLSWACFPTHWPFGLTFDHRRGLKHYALPMHANQNSEKA